MANPSGTNKFFNHYYHYFFDNLTVTNRHLYNKNFDNSRINKRIDSFIYCINYNIKSRHSSE